MEVTAEAATAAARVVAALVVAASVEVEMAAETLGEERRAGLAGRVALRAVAGATVAHRQAQEAARAACLARLAVAVQAAEERAEGATAAARAAAARVAAALVLEEMGVVGMGVGILVAPEVLRVAVEEAAEHRLVRAAESMAR